MMNTVLSQHSSKGKLTTQQSDQHIISTYQVVSFIIIIGMKGSKKKQKWGREEREEEEEK